MSLLEIYGDEPFDIFFDEFGVDVEIIQEEGSTPFKTRGILEAPGEEDSSGNYVTTTWSLILRTFDFVQNGNYTNYTIQRGDRVTAQKRDCLGEVIPGSVKRFICTGGLVTELPDGATSRMTLEADDCSPIPE